MRRQFKSNFTTNGRIRKDPNKTGQYVKSSGKNNEHAPESEEIVIYVKEAHKQKNIIRKGVKWSRNNINA